MRLNDIAKQLNVYENFDNFDLQIEVCKFVYGMLSTEYRLDQFSGDDNKIIYDLGTSYYEWEIVEQFTRTPLGSRVSNGWKFIGQKSDKEHTKQRYWKAIDPSNIWVVIK